MKRLNKHCLAYIRKKRETNASLFAESTAVENCTKDMYRCKNGSCLNRTRVCDLTKDCAEGEDEEDDCGNCQIIIPPLSSSAISSVRHCAADMTDRNREGCFRQNTGEREMQFREWMVWMEKRTGKAFKLDPPSWRNTVRENWT